MVGRETVERVLNVIRGNGRNPRNSYRKKKKELFGEPKDLLPKQQPYDLLPRGKYK